MAVLKTRKADVIAFAETFADVAAAARRLIPTGGMSAVGRSTLRRLVDHDGIRVGELAELEGVTQPGMTQLVARMAEHGLVERRTDPGDGRVVLVAITDAGRARIEQIKHDWVLVLAERLSVLSSDEMAALHAAAPALQHLLLNT